MIGAGAMGLRYGILLQEAGNDKARLLILAAKY